LANDVDGPPEWMGWWTVFYWGWWLAWCPSVGMFIARISRGRTVRQFLVGTMAAPVCYSFLWLTIFGGAGLKMEREAAGANLCCHNLHLEKLINNKTVEIEANRNNLKLDKLDKLFSNETNLTAEGLGEILCDGPCNTCSTRLLEGVVSGDFGGWKDEITLMQEASWWGVTVPDRRLTRLSCRKTEQMWFDLMMSYGDPMGLILSFASLFCMFLYFVTTVDSGSLVVDSLASNGQTSTSRLQRLLWSATAGVLASALLLASGTTGLAALQSLSIAMGVIYAVLITVACFSLQQGLNSTLTGGHKGSDSTVDCLTPHLLQPFATEPYSQLCLSSVSLSALALIKTAIVAPYIIKRVCKRLRLPSFLVVTFQPCKDF